MRNLPVQPAQKSQRRTETGEVGLTNVTAYFSTSIHWTIPGRNITCGVTDRVSVTFAVPLPYPQQNRHESGAAYTQNRVHAQY